jgi:hypothetical protein
MLLLLAITHLTSVRIAEVAFLLILIAGIWLVAAELLPPRLQKMRMVVVGIALAVAGLLLLIATHWGLFG